MFLFQNSATSQQTCCYLPKAAVLKLVLGRTPGGGGLCSYARVSVNPCPPNPPPQSYDVLYNIFLFLPYSQEQL